VLAIGGNIGSGVNGGPSFSSAELYTPVTQGLATSQTGLTFRVTAGSGAIPLQSVAVLSNTASIPWTVSSGTAGNHSRRLMPATLERLTESREIRSSWHGAP